VLAARRVFPDNNFQDGFALFQSDERCNTDRSECVVCAEERKELSLPAAAGGLKIMGYGRMAMHRPGGVLPGGHSPSQSLLLVC
jgi:hypothetical protein